MKFFYVILCVILTSIIIFVISYRPDKDISKDYQYYRQEVYQVDKAVNIKINSCLTNVIINLHQKDYIVVEVFYNQSLNTEFRDSTFIVNKQSSFCNSYKKIDALLIIVIPSNLISLNLEINAYFTLFDGSNLTSDTFNYKTSASDFNLENSSVKKLQIDISKGQISLREIMSENVSVYNGAGKVIFNDSLINNKTEISLNKGDIIFNNVKTSIINHKITVGYLRVYNVEAENVNLNNNYGDIELENLYSNLIYINVITGNINFNNTNEQFIINQVKFSLIKGETNFKINGKIIKV